MKPCNRCEVLKRVGPMNRSVSIQQATETRSAEGDVIETWATIRGWRAARKDVRGAERMRSDQELAERTSVFTGRWFAGLTAKMRLWHDDMAWDVTGIAEIGRREFLEVTAVAVRV